MRTGLQLDVIHGTTTGSPPSAMSSSVPVGFQRTAVGAYVITFPSNFRAARIVAIPSQGTAPVTAMLAGPVSGNTATINGLNSNTGTSADAAFTFAAFGTWTS